MKTKIYRVTEPSLSCIYIIYTTIKAHHHGQNHGNHAEEETLVFKKKYKKKYLVLL